MTARSSFRIALLIAAATLGSALTAPAANAGLQWNGPVFQGPILQGPVFQGPIFQGISLQGVTLRGTSLNTRGVTDAKPGRFVAVTLPNGETIPLR